VACHSCGAGRFAFQRKSGLIQVVIARFEPLGYKLRRAVLPN
jgi:hypothetical protein